MEETKGLKKASGMERCHAAEDGKHRPGLVLFLTSSADYPGGVAW